MAGLHCVSSCVYNPKQFSNTSISCTSSRALVKPITTLKPLSFTTNISGSFFSKGNSFSMMAAERPTRRGFVVVCDAVAPGKKADSAAKRARQAEKRRVYNKGKKSEMKTRMKKVFEALDGLKKKSDAESDEIITIEKLIAEAYSAIDKAVKAGSLHRNTGANRKSRLARRKKAIEILRGWYTPAAPDATVAA
ncbi:hypothetical protein GIB67_028668 [Kingdonia uniflora]|uniref:Small ribosomal subunit protein bS20c n=1 Tax=Kingdonia uniflora TaxID=39325 RepID=A0A7J7MTT0_9MAGN|nr:hypothetical protein GIB67_028668 [Kingdonia uniflora]